MSKELLPQCPQGGALLRSGIFVALCAFRLCAAAASLVDPEVDAYNVRLGSQTFGPRYQFSTGTKLVETADALRDMGSDIVKFYAGRDYPGKYSIILPTSIRTLTDLARSEPSCRHVLDASFVHFFMWTYCFAASSDTWWKDGFSVTEQQKEYAEIYGFSTYLLTNYNNSGKRFYLGHWEGDWHLLPSQNGNTNPTAIAVQGMIDWLNTRQKAVDDAMRNIPHTNVFVFNYTEANRVRDAMTHPTNSNQRVINTVVPGVTNLDYVSWSSYDGMNLGASDLTATLNYMASMVPTNKSLVIPGKRVFVGEYGWGSLSSSAQEPPTRLYIQRLLSWGAPFVLFWEMYDNENQAFWLIDSSGTKTPCYFLHQRFINRARLRVAQFKESNGRVPTPAEFGPLVFSLLNAPLAAPTNIVVANLPATEIGSSSTRLSCALSQGVYSDDCATVIVFLGQHDGGSNPLAWEQGFNVGLNTNFNTESFSLVVTNLQPSAGYFFRFFASNAVASAWAPLTGQFTTKAELPTNTTITVTVADASLSLRWALNASNYAVSAASSLSPPIHWELLTNQPTMQSDAWEILLPLHVKEMEFFRLESR